jgi:hypothetical protein
MPQYSSTTKYHQYIIKVYIIDQVPKSLEQQNFRSFTQQKSNSAGLCILIGVSGANLATNWHVRRYDTYGGNYDFLSYHQKKH